MWRPIATAPSGIKVLIEGKTPYEEIVYFMAIANSDLGNIIPMYWLDLENPQLMNAGENDYPDQILPPPTLKGSGAFSLASAASCGGGGKGGGDDDDDDDGNGDLDFCEEWGGIAISYGMCDENYLCANAIFEENSSRADRFYCRPGCSSTKIGPIPPFHGYQKGTRCPYILDAEKCPCFKSRL